MGRWEIDADDGKMEGQGIKNAMQMLLHRVGGFIFEMMPRDFC